jgi:hypothetical protein
MKHIRYQIQLDCGCMPYFPSPIPLLGDVLNCSVHGEAKRVDVDWYFKCQHCRYGRGVGNSPMTAEVKATSHAIRCHHRVRVWNTVGSKILEDFVVPPVGSQLVIGLDAPPF